MDGESVKLGQLNLVDLAGSECIQRSGAKGDRMREVRILPGSRRGGVLHRGHPKSHFPCKLIFLYSSRNPSALLVM